jgi:hypothetical protein
MQTVYLDPRLVPPSLRGGYTGNKFKAVIAESVTIPADAGLWYNGSREHYGVVRISDGVVVAMPGQGSSPWNPDRKEQQITIKSGFAVVRHSYFSGKDMGLTFYLSPQDAAPMLPAPVELSPDAALVLEYTATRKSSYMGKDRYQMALDDIRAGYCKREPLSREQWNDAKNSLINLGFLNKAGAITPAGRNARAA